MEEVGDRFFFFSGYLTENDEIVGVKLWVDYGHGYGFNNGTGTVELKPGSPFCFSYEATRVDDDGCPEEFSIDYVVQLYDWDERLLSIEFIEK